MKTIITKKAYRYGVVGAIALIAITIGVLNFSHHAAEAASSDTITFSLTGSNDSWSLGTASVTANVTASTPTQTVSSAEVNLSGVKYIAPSFTNSGKGTFTTDFRIGVQVCEYPGSNCGTGWTYWASDIAKQGFNVYSAPAVFVSADPSHDRLHYVTVYLQTRPLPSGTQFQAEVGERMEEYDYVFPNTPWMEGANVSEPMDPYCGGTFTPVGGGTGPAVGAEERLGTCRGTVISNDPDDIELTIDAYNLKNFDASYVSANIPSTFGAGDKKMADSNGNPLEITMKNTGTALWPMAKGAATGTPTGTCQTDADGSGVNDAPTATTTHDGKSCTTNFIYTSTYVLSHTGSFGVDPVLAQATKLVPITITYTAPARVCYTDPDPGDCPGNPRSYNPAFNNKSPLVPTAHAMSLCGSTGGTKVCDMTDGGYSYSYGASANINPGDQAVFTLKSMTAPLSGTSYTETWQMEQGTTPFGSVASIPITIGGGSPVGTITVTSANSVPGQALIPADWSGSSAGHPAFTMGYFTDKNIDVCAHVSSSCSGTSTTYGNLPADGIKDDYRLDASAIVPVQHPEWYALRSIEEVAPVAKKPASIGDALLSFVKSGLASVASAATPDHIEVAPGQTGDDQVLGGSNTNGTFTILWDPVALMSISPTTISLSTGGTAENQKTNNHISLSTLVATANAASNPSADVTISNVGGPGSALNWKASITYVGSTTGWLAVNGSDHASGSATAGNPSTATFTGNPGALATGTYQATVLFVNESTAVPVTTSLTISFAVNPPGGCTGSGYNPCSGSGCPGTPPTVSITPSSGTITRGSSQKLTITSTNATTCIGSGDWSGTIPCSGSIIVSPNAVGTYKYMLKATNSYGSAQAIATLDVTSSGCTGSGCPPPGAGSCALQALPSSIAPGGSATIYYQCSNVDITSCLMTSSDDPSFGTKSLSKSSGSVSVKPTANATYSVNCTDGTNAAVQVTVTNPGLNETNP